MLIELSTCPLCGGPLEYASPRGSYIVSEIVCSNCGFVYERVFVFQILSKEQVERIAEDLKKIGGNIKILGSKPLTKKILSYILREKDSRYLEKLLQIIRIKLTSCIECGKLLEYTTKKPRRCPACRREHRRKKDRERKRRIRARKYVRNIS